MEYNWGLIRSGETFQVLVNALLRAESPDLIGFSRLGKDGAQDARSADGKKAWQAKYHSEITGSRLISDAKKELENIEKYQNSEHSRFGQWKDVKEWELVTTDSFNPTDQAAWDSVVVTRAEKLGLKATFIDRARLEELLNKHRDIAEAFFGAANRCLLSLGEARDFVSADTIGAEGLKVALVDRAAQIDLAKNFLESDKKLMSVIGPGGIGKTRFLLEVGEIAEASRYQVLWGLEAAMTASSAWLVGIVAEQKTLLLIDEPKDPRMIDQLAEQLKNTGGRLDLWKTVVTTRAQKGPILEALAKAKAISAKEIELPPLNKNAAEHLAIELLNADPNLNQLHEDKKKEVAEYLSKMVHRNPVWITIAVRILGRGGKLSDLPNDSEGIAHRYVDELLANTPVKHCTPQQMDGTVNWLALCGEIDIEDRDTVTFVAGRIPFATPAQFTDALQTLVSQRFAVRRGVKRNLISIRPDVIREFVVRDWLSTKIDDKRVPSSSADDLLKMVVDIKEGETIPPLENILKTIAVLEFSQALGGDDFDVLSPLIKKLMNVAEEGTTSDQERVVGLVHPFAFARLSEIVELSKTIRLHPRSDEVIKTKFYGDRVLQHRDVVLLLPWLLFNIAPYARSNGETKLLYDEMVELCRYECKMSDLQENSGKRAMDLLPRLFEGGKNYLTSYGKAAFDQATSLLFDLEQSTAPSTADLKVVEVVIGPFMSLERSMTTFDGAATFTVHQYIVSLSGTEGKRREELISILQRFAAGDCRSPLTRTAAWRLLASARSSAGRVRMQLEKSTNDVEFRSIQNYMKAGLAWVLKTIHKIENIGDLKSARQMWSWHVQFEKDPEIMALAQQCEEFYQAHRLVKRYHTFFDFDQYMEARALAEIVAAELAESGPEKIDIFLSEAAEFAGVDFTANRIVDVSTALADFWDKNPSITGWVDAALQNGDGEVLVFAFNLIRSRMRFLRMEKRGPELSAFLWHCFNLLATDDRRSRFLFVEFSRPHPTNCGVMTIEDLQFVQAVSQSGEYKIVPELRLHCLLGMHHVEEALVLHLSQEIWNDQPLDSRLLCFLAILQALHFIDLFKDDYPHLGVTPTIYRWLVTLLVNLPDVDDINDHAMHDFNQFLKRFGKMPIDWLCESIQKRKEMKKSSSPPERDQIKVLPWRNRLPHFCDAIDSDRAANPEEIAAVSGLIEMYNVEPESRFFLLEYLTDLDPQGRVLPDIVVAQIVKSREPIGEAVREWSALAGHYRFNSDPWRKIAIAACTAVEKLTKRDVIATYLSLCPQGVRSSQYNVGEMDPRYQIDLDQCQREFEEETIEELIPFRKWRLQDAQEDFDRALAEFNAEHED